MTAKVTVADVERVAELAHLELAPDEIEPMLRDLNAILDYVAELNQLDTSGIEPLAQVGELENAAIPQPRAGSSRAVARSRSSSWRRRPKPMAFFSKCRR